MTALFASSATPVLELAASRRGDPWGPFWEKLGVFGVGIAVFLAVVGLLLFLGSRTSPAVTSGPSRRSLGERIQPVLLLGPAVLLLGIGLVYPAIRTMALAFTDRTGREFIGWANFEWTFTQPETLLTLLNTLVWVALVPLLSTGIGLLYAVFIDRSRGERVYKALVFMPLAISFVGAGIIWRFVYEYRAEGYEQIGILNQLLVWLGQEPQQFLVNSPWNNLFLIIVMIWIQTGFSMVLCSAAIKGISADIVEAARLDGAGAWQRFWNVTLPSIRGTLIVVLTTITIATLKVFDIVRAMTGGNFGTSVVANEMYTQAFNRGEFGKGSALAVLLFLMVLPIVIYNVRSMRKQREIA